MLQACNFEVLYFRIPKNLIWTDDYDWGALNNLVTTTCLNRPIKIQMTLRKEYGNYWESIINQDTERILIFKQQRYQHTFNIH